MSNRATLIWIRDPVKLRSTISSTPTGSVPRSCVRSVGYSETAETIALCTSCVTPRREASTTTKTRNVFMVAPRRLDTLPVIALRCLVDVSIFSAANPSHERVPVDTTESSGATSEVNREEGRDGVRNVARPATVRLRPNPGQRKQ